MKLVHEKIENTINMVRNKLNCHDANHEIAIHYMHNKSTTRCSGCIEEFDIQHDNFYIVIGWFQLEIRDVMLDIQYVENTTIHIIYSDGELYLDLD